jgi:hypothetical protein
MEKIQKLYKELVKAGLVKNWVSYNDNFEKLGDAIKLQTLREEAADKIRKGELDLVIK